MSGSRFSPLLCGTSWLLVACSQSAPEIEPAPAKATPLESTEPPAWFVERAVESGLAFDHVSGHREAYLMPEIMGGGAALFDMDSDGDLDAYLVQSGSLYDEAPAPTNALFRGRGDGSFEDVTPGSGAGHPGYGMGVACGDVDRDGDLDLYVTNFGPNVLLLNDGQGTFADGTEAARVGDPSWGSSAAFCDFENDGDLDLYVANYLDWQTSNELPCRNQMGTSDFCSPLNYESPAPDTVYRNEGAGRFTDISAELGTAESAGTGLGVTCADFDGDGLPEIFVANDGMPNFLWVRTESGWRESGVDRGCALDSDGLAKAGMGVDVEDLDSDGDPDLLVCNLRNEADSYYRNDGTSFRDRTVAVGLSTLSRPYTRFGLGWADFDQDGQLDLFEAGGRVMRQSHTFADDPYAEPNLLFRGLPNGRFEAVAQPEQPATNSRAAAFGDVDNDGGVDVLVVNLDGPAQLFLNRVSERGSWIAFDLFDPGGSALHARVAIERNAGPAFGYSRAAASYQASNDPRVHFGLGEERLARQVTVSWPDGSVEAFGDLEAGRTHRLTRGSGLGR